MKRAGKILSLLFVFLLFSCSPHYTFNNLADPDINLLGKDDSDFPDINRILIYSVNGQDINALLATTDQGKLKMGRNEIVIYYTYKKGAENSPVYYAYIPLVVNFVTNMIYYAKVNYQYPYALGWIEDHNGKKVTGMVQVPLLIQQPNGFVPAAVVNRQPVTIQPVVQPYDIGITPTGKLQ